MGEVKTASAGFTGGGEISPVGVPVQPLMLLLSSLWPFCSTATIVMAALGTSSSYEEGSIASTCNSSSKADSPC